VYDKGVFVLIVRLLTFSVNIRVISSSSLCESDPTIEMEQVQMEGTTAIRKVLYCIKSSWYSSRILIVSWHSVFGIDFNSNPNPASTGMAVVESTMLTAGIAAASRAMNAANLAKGGGPKYKKAPDAPKRFKSAFIIFSAEKHKEIKDNLIQQGRTEKVGYIESLLSVVCIHSINSHPFGSMNLHFTLQTTDIAKLVSEAWREMPPDEKENWEKKARKDKARYEVEKSMYKGPWKVPANKRTPKDPSAPKRPMSAFLAFSNKRRAGLKREHPEATNADLSKMLSKTWREAPDELRKKYMDEEAGLRATYKIEVAKWRKKVADERKQERTEREAVAMQTAELRAKEPPVMMSHMSVPGGGFGMNASAPPTSDMSAGGLYGGGGGVAGVNPYGMAGSFVGMPQDASQQYANLMNPFASAQPFMGNNPTQQQLLSQLFGTFVSSVCCA
jgi:HMG (high mobility group) box